jgi:hypothetical protein
MFRFVLVCSLAQMVVRAMHQSDLVGHYGLIEFCIYAILGCGVAWFIWRACAGTERDLDFYDDF